VIERFGGGVRVELPDPVPADALRDYAANAQLLGLSLQLVFLGFAVAVVALAAGLVRSVVATVMLSLGTLLALPLVSVLDPVEPWLPSSLVVALDGLLRGAPLSEYLPRSPSRSSRRRRRSRSPSAPSGGASCRAATSSTSAGARRP
jgi:hypothetical protein